jgi:hypothetical protein
MVFHLAQPVTVKLAEARPVTGGLIFQMVLGRQDDGRRSGGRATRMRPQ